MNCERARAWVSDAVSGGVNGGLSGGVSAGLAGPSADVDATKAAKAHVAGCPSCRAFEANLPGVLRGLAALRDSSPEPSPRLRRRLEGLFGPRPPLGATQLEPRGGVPALARKRSSRGWAFAAALLLLGIAFAAFTAWRATSDGSELGQGEAGLATAMKTKPHVEPRFDPRAWTSPHSSLNDMAVPGGTPALEPAPTDADGHLEVEVLAAGAPKAGAEVRLYLRGMPDPSTGLRPWHLAGGGATDAHGKLLVAAPPGSYVLAVRSPGFPVTHRDVSRALEGLTRVTLELQTGTALRGRVVENGSGVEVPLAQVSLARFSQSTSASYFDEGALDYPPEESAFATADARGRFELSSLEAGEYRLLATAPGHGYTSQKLSLPHGSDLLVSLSPAGNLEGWVVDAHGAPAAGAEVTVLYTGRRGLEILRTTTGPKGGFTAEVPPGRCTVTARLGPLAGAADEPVVVSARATKRGITLRLGGSSAIEGRVTAKDTRAPIDGALVTLTPHPGMGDLGRASTSDGGQFAVEPLAAGTYDVDVYAQGYTHADVHGVTLGPAQRFPLTLELERSASVSGTVRDSAGRPVPDAVVEGGEWFGGPVIFGTAQQVRSQADGSYRLDGLGSDRVQLRAGRQSGAWLALKHVMLHPGDNTQLDFVLREVGTLAGRVASKSGAPLATVAPAGVVVRALPRDGDALPTPSEVLSAEVGADGLYSFDLPAGQYSVGAGRADDPSPLPLLAAVIAVQAGLTTEADLTLDETPLLVSGTVLDRNGGPSPSALVALTAPPANFMLVLPADDTGHFEFPQMDSVSAPPVLKVTARNGGRQGQVAGVAVGTHGVVVRLEPGGSLEGTVTGEPVPDTIGVQVMLVDDSLTPGLGGDPQQFVGTHFSLPDVLAGTVSVFVTTSDGRSGSARVDVPAGGTAQVAVEVQGSGSVSGRLVGPNGKPVVAGMVSFDSAPLEPVAPDGSFAFRNVAAGRHALRAFARGADPLQQQILVVVGQPLDLGALTMTPASQH